MESLNISSLSDNVNPGAKNGFSRSSTVVGFAWPQILHSRSSPIHIIFCTTMYSVQSCVLTCGGLKVSSLEPLRPPFTCCVVVVVWRLVMRTTTWRMPESGTSGICVARSDTTWQPRKMVEGRRRYLSRDHVTISLGARLLIRETRLVARPGQQIFLRPSTSPLRGGSAQWLLSRETNTRIPGKPRVHLAVKVSSYCSSFLESQWERLIVIL